MSDMNVDEFVEHIANRIDEEIRKKGMNHKEFAESIGRDSAWISNKLRGKRKMTLQDLYEIAIGFGFKGIEELMPIRYQKSMWEMLIENIFESIVKSEIEKQLAEHNDKKHSTKG